MGCVKAVWPAMWQTRDVTNMKPVIIYWDWWILWHAVVKGYRDCVHILLTWRPFISDGETDKTLQQFRLSSRAQFGWLPFHTCHALDCDSPLSWRSGCFIKLPDLCLTKSFEPHEISLDGQEESPKVFLHALFQCCGLACIISPHIWVSGFFQKHLPVKRTS